MPSTRYIVAGRFIDGNGADVLRDVFLSVKDGMIVDIGPASRLACNDKTVIDDFSHCIVLPALIDCSIALSRSPSVDMAVQESLAAASIEEKGALVNKHIGYCHAHGVLGMAGSDEIGGTLKHCMEGAGMRHSIVIKTSGTPFTNNNGKGNRWLDERNFTRINYSGNIGGDETAYPRVNYETLRRILEQKGRQKAVVVANGKQQVAEAIEAGCDAIEQGYAMGEDNLREMAQKGVLWIPNLVRAKNGLDGASAGGEVCCRFSQRYVAPGKSVPGAEAFWKKKLAEQLGLLRTAGKLGVTMAMGTGAGSVGVLHGESMAEEIKLFIKAGFSLAETIRCATENGARFFGMETLGALTVGHHATFLIARGTLPQLPRKLSYLEGIYVDGLPSSSYRKNPVNAA